MGQSRVQNYIYLVFGTKYRQPFIRTPHEKEFHVYLGGIGKELECPAIKVGGYNDHVHTLLKL